jgi:GTP cyclohydrolase II
MLIARARAPGLSDALALADPANDFPHPIRGPLLARPAPDASAIAAIRLARLAGLLPAFFTCREGGAEVELRPERVAAFEEPARLMIAARARLPIAAADTAEIVAFRSLDDATEHVALLIGTPDSSPPLVRLHSECLTGDVLGSLKCDCGAQLQAALQALAGVGWGMLLYLRQEGRGIGLVNKLRAYALQDQGLDTVDANMRLGFAIDMRDFAIAARMLALLGQRHIRLLTNNPAKVAGLQAAGINVSERVPHALPANPHNMAYLDTKRRRAGHLL